MNNFSIAISPCPNDTFIFDALINKKIDTKNYNFTPYLFDVETLNKSCFDLKYDICKISYHAFLFVNSNYQLFNSGSALGENVGPLFITNSNTDISKIKKVAIPGEYTTASWLFKAFNTLNVELIPYTFSDIEDAIIKNKVDAGVIIHENRFTYQEKGLKKIFDLGKLWFDYSNLPIPLGGIAVKRNFNDEIKLNLNKMIKESIEYAFRNKNQLPSFVTNNAQEMEPEIMKKHIDLYVNHYSIDLGKEGKEAIMFFINQSINKRIINNITNPIFVQ